MNTQIAGMLSGPCARQLKRDHSGEIEHALARTSMYILLNGRIPEAINGRYHEKTS